MIRAEDLIAKFQQALDEHWGYIWGAAGGIWTQKQQDTATRPQTIAYGSKWVGKHVADCSGLFSWAFKALGEYIAHGSNSIWKSYCTEQGTITKGMQLKPGTAVFKTQGEDRYHIGLFIGNNRVIEAKSTEKGVTTSRLSAWNEWGVLKNVAYEGDSEMSEATYPTLKRGMKGDTVRMLQERLIALGYDCGNSGADGQYGKATVAAVKAFQTASSLAVDGVCGGETWAALMTELPAAAEPSDAEKLALLWAWYTASQTKGV